MPGGYQFEIRLHLYVLVYRGVTWSANPHMERALRVDGVPTIGAPITVGGESFRVAKLTHADDGPIIECILEDDLTVAISPGGPSDLVLPPFDETALTARVTALEAAGWARSVTPHVRTHTGAAPGLRG